MNSNQEILNKHLVLDNLQISNALIYGMEINYLKGPLSCSLEHKDLELKLQDELAVHSQAFYANIYQFISKAGQGLMQQTAFFERMELNSEKAWYYTMVSVDKMNAFNFPNRLAIVSLPVLRNSGISNKANRVFELNSFQEENRDKYEKLTKREIEVLRWVATGMNNPQIAEKLYISRRTVEQHRKNINRKLGPNSLGDLITYARAFDLI